MRGKGFDTLQYDAFRYAIAVTGEPQLVSISDAQDASGHEILAYRVEPAGIFVADPNVPDASTTRLVPFDLASGTFGTYFSGTSASAVAAGSGVTYANFVYDAKTALVDWSALAADWAAFEAGTIGAGVFPAYDLTALAGQDDQGNDIWVPLVDGYQTTDDTLTIRISDPRNADQVRMKVFQGTSSTLAAPAGQQVSIALKAGANPLGIYEQGSKPAWTTWEYVDFVRLTVTLGPAESPSAATTGDHWVLTSTTSKLGGPGTFSVVDQTVNSTNGRVTISSDTEYQGGVLHAVTTVSWGPPPASAAPGDTWATTLSAEVNSSFVLVAMGVDAFWTGDGGVAQTEHWRVAVDPGNTTGSSTTDLSWVFPSPYPASGSKIEIVVSSVDDWTYTYTWQP